MDTILEELSPVRKRGQCAPAFTMHQRRRSLDRLTSPEDRHTAVISRVLAPSGARLLSWASDGHRPKAQLEGPQTLLIAGFGWDEKNSVCYLAISQATVRGILSMEVIPARHWGDAHLHLPRHWFADTLKFGPILSEPFCFPSSLHPDKPHGARCRDSQIHHSCTQAEGGGGAGQSGSGGTVTGQETRPMCTCIYDAPAPAITRQTDQSGGSPHRSDQQGACTVWSSPPKLGKRWASAQSPARGAPDFAHRRIRLGREEFCVLFGYLTGNRSGDTVNGSYPCTTLGRCAPALTPPLVCRHAEIWAYIIGARLFPEQFAPR